MALHFENVMGGGQRQTTKAHQVGGAVKINGTAAPFGSAPACIVVGGFALTPGIDREFFETWLEQNRDSDVVKNGLIFAHGNQNMVSGQANEAKALTTGLEPLNPTRTIKNGKSVAVDPRFPRSKFGHGIETGQTGEQAA